MLGLGGRGGEGWGGGSVEERRECGGGEEGGGEYIFVHILAEIASTLIISTELNGMFVCERDCVCWCVCTDFLLRLY